MYELMKAFFKRVEMYKSYKNNKRKKQKKTKSCHEKNMSEKEKEEA